MKDEKKTILIQRIMWLSIFILGTIIPIIIISATKNVTIVSQNCYINEYYEYSDTTSCDVEVVCDKDVDYAYITVAFYDINGNLLNEEEKYFSGHYWTGVISATFSVDGKVESFEILDYNIRKDNKIEIWILVFFFTSYVPFSIFILSLLLSYEEYEYNGNIIAVYSGYFHHYLCVNDTKVDEYNSITSYTPICLSGNIDDAQLLATISLSNRIILKINNKLYTKKK